MDKCIFDMPSYTYAVKGKKLLDSQGIRSTISRREKKCGYSLKIHDECEKAENLLARFSIPYEKTQ